MPFQQDSSKTIEGYSPDLSLPRYIEGLGSQLDCKYEHHMYMHAYFIYCHDGPNVLYSTAIMYLDIWNRRLGS